MKIWKLVSGILSCIFFVLVAFQSCAAGVVNTLEDNGEVSGSAGIIVAILMLAGGIVSIATKKSEKKGGNIALIILFGLAALMGFSNYGNYSDLAIWSGWCLINAVLAVVAIFMNRKHKDNPTTPNAA
jgi:Ca2+/Na+ antiporter